MDANLRYSSAALTQFAESVLLAAGLQAKPAQDVAHTLVQGDMLGHDTHGLALLAPYVKELETGSMERSGAPVVLNDRGATLLWDGRRLPGPWLVHEGLTTLMPRAREFGTATLVIRRSHHIACLASYLLRATDAGFMLLLSCSDPSGASVAPHGGTRAVFTPNPIAVGVPTSTTPFLVDISSSIKTNGMSARMHQAGKLYNEEVMLDAAGNPSRDPGVLSTTPPGTILPLGGMSNGHKGFGMALLIEALTGALAGHGRADPAEGWGATVYMTLYDPEAFSGVGEFVRQTDWIADACRNNPPRPGVDAVRMPGDRGLALRSEQERLGVKLHSSIPPKLAECARKYAIEMPEPAEGW